MRFEVTSAFGMAALFPLLATCLEFCRQHYTLTLATLRGDLADYVASALLLIAGWLAIRARPLAPIFAVVAWAYFASLMFGSSWAQIDYTLSGQAEEFNAAIIVGKLAILAIGLTALVLSVRRIPVRQI